MSRRTGYDAYMDAAGLNDSNSSSSESSVSVRTSQHGRITGPVASSQGDIAEMRRRLMQRLAAQDYASHSRQSQSLELTSGGGGSSLQQKSARAPSGSKSLQLSDSRQSASINVTHHEERMAHRTQSRMAVREQTVESDDVELTIGSRDSRRRIASKSPRKSRTKPQAAEGQSSSQRLQFDPKGFSTPFVDAARRIHEGSSDADNTLTRDLSRISQKRAVSKAQTGRPSESVQPSTQTRSRPPDRELLSQPEEEEEEEEEEEIEDNNQDEQEAQKRRQAQRKPSPVGPARSSRQVIATKSRPTPNPKAGTQSTKSPISPKVTAKKTTPKKKGRQTKQKAVTQPVVMDDAPLFPDSDDEVEEREPTEHAQPVTASPEKTAQSMSRHSRTSKSQTRLPQSDDATGANSSRRDSAKAAVGRGRTTEAATSKAKSTSKARRKQSVPQKKGGITSTMMGVIKQIKTMQLSTDLLIPRLPFTRLVREVTQEIAGPMAGYRYTADAVEALQSMTEHYLTTLFCDANRVAAHANRVTVMPKDLDLLRLLGLVDT